MEPDRTGQLIVDKVPQFVPLVPKQEDENDVHLSGKGQDEDQVGTKGCNCHIKIINTLPKFPFFTRLQDGQGRGVCAFCLIKM